jgi:hypothetical protein
MKDETKNDTSFFSASSRSIKSLSGRNRLGKEEKERVVLAPMHQK